MSRKLIQIAVLAALAGFSSFALADPPAMVGRISAVQGQVTLVGDDEPMAASLNWPVTGASHLTTASGARTEFRVGSTAVRLDGDSDLEIIDLDDDLLHLRLNYGSVSIRVRSPELLRDFELSTPQARITLLEPGLLRVDAERVTDTSQISMLAGSARVDGAGSSVTVSPGRHVDVSSVDVSTSVARRDGFDVWSDERDRAAEAVVSSRFVSTGMTGYEELDRNGSWTESVEYGALWTPRTVAIDWAPYRDGRWIWLAPWGWTWVDNAPWGYAPSHYGRWVMVERRWCWAPGRPAGRPVWAPALVGWVGGDGFVRDHRPGLGWFPLSPRERYVPAYQVSIDYERRMSWTHNGKSFEPRTVVPGQVVRRDGLTVLPRDQFEGRHRTVQVPRGQQVIPAASLAATAAPVAPPQPSIARTLDTNRRGWQERDHDGRPDRPVRVLTAPSVPQPAAPLQPGRTQTTTTLAPGQFGHPDAPPQTIQPGDVRIDVRPYGRPGQTPGQAPGQMPGTPHVQQANPVLAPTPTIQQANPPITVTPNIQRANPPITAAPIAAPTVPTPFPANRERDDSRRPYRQQEERRPVQQPQQQIQPQPQQQIQLQPQQPAPQVMQPQRQQPQAQPQAQPQQQQRDNRDKQQDRRKEEGNKDRGDNRHQNRE
ncbi:MULTISPECIES: DUF6600 domain-containing protein [unclassified Duganella]|uniref:DUF6600 domain-containing protein n=1 Tax=unclassified Duganella TaxID=2636909 RepID=UPI000E349B54|nr:MULTISPECIES: DUF6600 domain-containing protein [unclassified Duganella]RFP12861.1 hypothetical protein D0T23_17385 [Duganella sp. BJB475]RFP28870.1 hypothetical protein D0T21_21370 [Duganella sp. BJB476]